MPLTDTAVRHAKPGARNYTLNDADGLQLFVSAAGSKQWHFRFCWAGKQPRISLGTYPEIGLLDARRLRDAARAQAYEARRRSRDVSADNKPTSRR